MSILGNRVVRVEDPRFLTDGGRYVADLDLPDAVHAVFVRSNVAQGLIESVETSEAESAPGIVGVFTAADLDLAPFSNPDNDILRRFPLARDQVHFSGEPVAAILAESQSQAIDAAEQVYVEVEPLDAVTTIESALADEVLVHNELGTNVTEDKRATDLDFSSCEVFVDAQIANSRINGAAIEPRVAAAFWADGQVTCWSSTQGAHPAQAKIASVLKLAKEDVRVITTDVGGSFGSKAGPGPEESILGALSRAVGRPVMWVETRTENLLAMGHARSQLNRVRIGGSADGRITHYQLDIVAEAGAYPEMISFLPYFTQIMATGVYDIANAACGWISVTTNAPPTTAFRGAGRPEATAAIERAVDLFAGEAGLDPASVRRTNMVAEAAFPWTSPMGQVYDSGTYVQALDSALAAVDYEALRSEQVTRRESNDPSLLGIGMSSYVEITAPNPAPNQSEFGSVSLEADGTVLARTGSTPYGQGHETTWAMIVADRMGVALDRIKVVWGDTDEVPSSGLTGGSRSVQLAGSAMADATDRLIEIARFESAKMIEAAPEDIVFDAVAGAFHVAGTPSRSIGWATIAESTNQKLTGLSEFGQNGATFPFGTHVAVVEVDSGTGGVRLLRFVTVDDAGTLINPMIAEGQVHGGISAGVSQALYEEIRYDEFGNLSTATFADYALPAASEFPQFEVTLSETPTPLNPLGAKGIGEAGSVGSTPAVQNAVIDAFAHLGVRHIDMPLTPVKLWAAYSKATAAAPV